MFAARDQENLVHGHQAAAAAKPLNQGVKQLAPKTPGNKTAKLPLRLPLNDENGTTAFGGGKKTVGKGNGNSIFGGKKDGMENKSFVTPMGTSCRSATSIQTSDVDPPLARTAQSSAPRCENNECQSQSLSDTGPCSE